MMDNEKYCIEVKIKTTYLPEQSDVGTEHFVFAYTITIVNTGRVASQLISRHWIITDGDGSMHEVRGLGVVGNSLC